MTSKTLSYKFAKDNRKHKLGVIILSIIFAVVIVFAFLCCIHNVHLTDPRVLDMTVQEFVLRLVKPNAFLAVLMSGMGAIFAINSFSYLHVKSKVDFYHSLPIKREQLYLVNIINDVLIFAVPILVSGVLICICSVTVSALNGAFVSAVVDSFICYLLSFLAAYLTAALAMIMTGNRLTALLGMAVFASYFPLILREVIPVYSSLFFNSFVPTQKEGHFLTYLSPVSLSYRLTANYPYWSWSKNGKYVAALLVMIIILFLLCGVLYKKRSSEMAEKSMAFSKSKNVIRILLVIPFALYTGCALYSILMESSKIWVLIGTIIGTIFFHAFIEIIYQSDIRGMWAHKRQMAATALVSLAIVAIFWIDPIKYDTYVPKAENVESVSICLNHYPYSDFNNWDDNMENDVMAIKGDGLSDILKDLSDVANASLEKSEHMVDVTYRMKNGKISRRSYAVPKVVQEAMAKKIYDTPDYKKSMYYLYQEKWDTINDIYYEEPDRTVDLMQLLSKEEQKEFLQIYLKELDTLTFKQMKSEKPVSSFHIEYKINDQNVGEQHYIYPTFKKTLTYCKEKKIMQMPSLEKYNIKKLTVEIYDSDYSLVNDYTITDQKEINELLPNLGYYSVIDGSGYEGENDMVSIEAEAYIKDEIYYLSLTADEGTAQKLIDMSH